MKMRAPIILAACFAMTAGTAFALDNFVDSASQQLRFREAQTYANREEQRGITVGVEPFGKRIQKRLFGDNVGDFLTYDVAITNNTPFRIHINEISVFAGGAPVPGVDLNEVVDDIGPGGGKTGHMRQSILRNSLATKTLQNGIVEPNQTAQGVLFVPEDDLSGDIELMVRVQNLSRVAYLEYRIPVQVLD